MNIIKLINRLLFLFILLMSFNVSAEEKPFVVIETELQNIRLSDDGTGVVKNVYCSGCDFKIVNITPSSKATYRGVEVSILEVRRQKDKVIMVSFNPETQEVQYIRW